MYIVGSGTSSRRMEKVLCLREMITRTLSTRIVYAVIVRKVKIIRNSVLFEEMPASVQRAGHDLHRQFREVHQSVSGSTMDARPGYPLIDQKPTISWKELFDEYKKEQQEPGFKVAYPMTCGTAQRNAIVTCATCTTRWPMARQRMRKYVV